MQSDEGTKTLRFVWPERSPAEQAQVVARAVHAEQEATNKLIASKDREIAALKKALEPFAKRGALYADAAAYLDGNYAPVGITFGDLRRARSAHEGKT